MTAVTSSANGTYIDCGLSQGVALTLTCGGPSCGILAQFPHLACSNDPISSLTSCTNNVQCPGQTNFKSIFQMQQHPDNTVSVMQQLQVDGQGFVGSDDGQGVVSYSPVSGSSAGPGPGTSGTSVGGNSATPGTSGTRSPGISPAPSSANARRPPFSKALFVLLVALGMFIGQGSATYSSVPRLKSIALNTGVSLLWMFVLAPVWTQAQPCTTVGQFPQITPELSAFTSNGHLTVVGTYSVSNPLDVFCGNFTIFTATQTVVAVEAAQSFIAPAAIINFLPTTITHVFPTAAPAALPALGSIFELTGVWTGPSGFTGGGALFATLAPHIVSTTSSSSTTSVPPPALGTCSITGQIPGLSAFFSPLTGAATVSFIETYAKAGTTSCVTDVPFTIFETIIGKASVFTAAPVTITAVPVVITYGIPGLAHSMLATLGPTITRSAVWRDSSGSSIGGGSDFIVLPAVQVTTPPPPPVVVTTTTPPPPPVVITTSTTPLPPPVVVTTTTPPPPPVVITTTTPPPPVATSSTPPVVSSASTSRPTPLTTSNPPTTPAPAPTPTPIGANAQILSNINDLFPPGNAALLSAVEVSLCNTAVLPAISSVVSGQITRAKGVVNLVQACLQAIDAAEPKGGMAQQIFEFALGNLVVCDKFSNTVLEGTLVIGRSGICNAVVPSIPG